MPEYLAPGVYVEEIAVGPKPIEGVATSTAAFLGETERGPLRPRLVTSYAEYLRLFGGVFAEGKFMPCAVKSFFDNGGRRAVIARIIGAASRSARRKLGPFTVTALGPGAAGNRIFVRIVAARAAGRNQPKSFRLEVFYWDRPGTAPFDPIAHPRQQPRPALAETFDKLSFDPKSPNHWDRVVNGGRSALIVLAVAAKARRPARTFAEALGGGRDAAPGTADYRGEHRDPARRSGLAALEAPEYDEVALLYAPATGAAVRDLLIEHAERHRRFAVIDCEPGVTSPTDSRLHPRSRNDTSYAAFYYPWLLVADPNGGVPVKIPPGGAALGIYVRTDINRGVWKAPANETVNGIIGLEYDVDQTAQDLLNSEGVNVIRRFVGRGIRLWGARTLSGDPEWKYVNVRRLCLYVEASIDRGTQWVVFEPNDETLWARLRDQVTQFLRRLWRDGALMGTKETEAFYVRAGLDTMTADDILNGRLIGHVGIAPLRAAEFIVLRFGWRTQEGS